MKTLIVSTLAIMLFAGSASASSTFVANDVDHFGTDRYWVAVGQGDQ